MGITLIAYHAITDEKGLATFVLLSTKKYGFVFYLNEDRTSILEYAKQKNLVFGPKSMLLRQRHGFMNLLKGLFENEKVAKVTLQYDDCFDAISAHFEVLNIQLKIEQLKSFVPLSYVLKKFQILTSDLLKIQNHVFAKSLDHDLLSSVSTSKTTFLYQDKIEELIVIPLSVLVILIRFDRSHTKIKTLPTYERQRILQILKPLRYKFLGGSLSINWNEKNFDGAKPQKSKIKHKAKPAEKKQQSRKSKKLEKQTASKITAKKKKEPKQAKVQSNTEKSAPLIYQKFNPDVELQDAIKRK